MRLTLHKNVKLNLYLFKNVTETYQNARSVEKVVGEMSASDDNINNINIQAYDKCNASKKRLIKKRKLYGDTSNEGIYRIHFYKKFSL